MSLNFIKLKISPYLRHDFKLSHKWIYYHQPKRKTVFSPTSPFRDVRVPFGNGHKITANSAFRLLNRLRPKSPAMQIFGKFVQRGKIERGRESSSLGERLPEIRAALSGWAQRTSSGGGHRISTIPNNVASCQGKTGRAPGEAQGRRLAKVGRQESRTSSEVL